MAALRLANGVCVCVDGRGVIDVLHWTMVEPTPVEIDDMDDNNTNSVRVPTLVSTQHAQPHHSRSSAEVQPSSGGSSSLRREDVGGSGIRNPLRSEVHVESTESEGAHDSGSTFDSTATTASGGRIAGNTTSSSNTSPEMTRAELTCWRLEPPFDEMPRLPPGHCPPPFDHSRVAGLTSTSNGSAQSAPESVKKATSVNSSATSGTGSSSSSSGGGSGGTNGSRGRDGGARKEGLLAGVASGVVCCISATGRFVVSGGCTGSLAVQQLDLTSGLVCGEVAITFHETMDLICVCSLLLETASLGMCESCCSQKRLMILEVSYGLVHDLTELL